MKVKARGRDYRFGIFDFLFYFFYTPSNMKKMKSNFWGFFMNFSKYKSQLQKTKTKNEKSRNDSLFHVLLPSFWYANHLCSIKTDRVLLFWTQKKLKKVESWEKSPQSFRNLYLCIHTMYNVIMHLPYIKYIKYV